MSQVIWDTIVPSTTSGNQLATILNDFKAAIVSGLSGTSRPTELEAGGYWVDTTSAPIWLIKLFDGTDDITLFSVNITTNVASIPSGENSFTISKTSADQVAPLFTLLKQRIINNGQVLDGDYIGAIEFKGNADDLSVPVTMRVRVRATDDFTASAYGSDLIIEGTADSTAALSEIIRVRGNGRVGLGVAAPLEKLHLDGNVKAEKSGDDALPAKLITRKRRTSGGGQVLANDVIGRWEIASTDNSVEAETARVEAVAVETHTTSAHGTALSVQVKKSGTTTLVEKIRIGDQIQLNEILRVGQHVDAATTGSGASITPTNTHVKLTNASLVSVNNIVPFGGQLLVLSNATTVDITLVNDSGGTAANRIITGAGTDILIKNGEACLLIYDTDSSRWRLNSRYRQRVAFAANNASAMTLTNNAYTTVVCATETLDTHNAYNTSTGDFTVPTGEGGIYQINASMYAAATQTPAGSGRRTCSPVLRVNGTDVVYGAGKDNYQNTATASVDGSASGALVLAAGDVVTFAMFHNLGANGSPDVGVTTTFNGCRIA